MQDDPKLESGGAYLLTWQPNRFDLDLQGTVKRFNRGTLGRWKWATGSTKSMRLGAPFFFLRQGSDRPGIIGCGRIGGPVRQARHWDPTKARVGAQSNQVVVEFDFITMQDDLRAIPRSVLQSDRRTRGAKWDIQGSGTRLTADITEGVRALLQAGGVKMPVINTAAGVPWIRVAAMSEGAVQQVLTTRQERNRKARLACLEHHGCSCRGCGFDFGRFYGPDAEGMIEVHHLHPLSRTKKSRKVDPVKDLIPLCSNCHRVVHMPGAKEEPLSVPALRAMVRKHGKRTAKAK